MTRALRRLVGVRAVTFTVSAAEVVFALERATRPNPREGIPVAVERAAAVEGSTYTVRYL